MHHLDVLFEKNAASGSTDHEVQHPERGESQSSDTGLAGRGGGVISTATNRTYCHLSKSQAESATQWQIIAVEWIHEVRLPSARAAGVWSDDAVPSNANPVKMSRRARRLARCAVHVQQPPFLREPALWGETDWLGCCRLHELRRSCLWT